MSAEQKVFVQHLVTAPDGLDPVEASSPELDFLLRTGIVSVDSETGRVHLANKLAERHFREKIAF